MTALTPSSSYLSASQCLAEAENEFAKIEYSKERGRYFIASKDVPSGTVVLKSYPYATAIFDTQRKRVCANCMFVHPTKSFSLHCKRCDQVYLCSEQCYTMYIESGSEHNVDHSRLCPHMRKLATLKADKHMKSVAKMVLLLYWEKARAERGVKWIRSQEEWWKIGDRDITSGLEGLNVNKDIEPVESNFDMVLALESHYDHWTSDDRQGWKRLGTFLQAALTEAKLLNGIDTYDTIMHMISRVESNGFGMYWMKANKKRDQDPFGRAMFPHAAFFNHDCNRNCEATQLVGDFKVPSETDAEQVEADLDVTTASVAEQTEGQTDGQDEENNCPSPVVIPSVFDAPRGAFRLMVMRTLRDVQAEKPLCISYIDWDQPVAARRRKLLEEYFFECMCDRCMEESQAKSKGNLKGSSKDSAKVKAKAKRHK